MDGVQKTLGDIVSSSVCVFGAPGKWLWLKLRKRTMNVRWQRIWRTCWGLGRKQPWRRGRLKLASTAKIEAEWIVMAAVARKEEGWICRWQRRLYWNISGSVLIVTQKKGSRVHSFDLKYFRTKHGLISYDQIETYLHRIVPINNNT